MVGEFSHISLSELKLTDVGCGAGRHIPEFLALGFSPAHLTGIEVLVDRMIRAREMLPKAVNLIEGDAALAGLSLESQDVVLSACCFPPLLDDDFRQNLADRMWGWVKLGGGVIFYDFLYSNPANPDVRGVLCVE